MPLKTNVISEKQKKLSKKPTEIISESTNVPAKKSQFLTSNTQPTSNSFNKDWENLPLIHELPAEKHEEIVFKKLNLCCVVFDFNLTSNLSNRETKRNTLNELIGYFSNPDISISDFLYPEIVSVFSLNVFRAMPLQSSKPNQSKDSDDDEPVLEISWEHLELVYSLFLRFLEHPQFNSTASKKCIDHRFLVRLLDVFETDDPREREALKTVLHRIYGKFIAFRAFIRQQINNVFFSYIYENEKHNGIAELLEILGSIINGFQIPLKDEHKVFLKRVLLPLHKVRRLSSFHPQLAYCVKEFVIKEDILVKTVLVDGLIRFWPKVCSFKQIMFLHELEDCVETVGDDAFKEITHPLFHLLSRCISSPQSQVTERVLLMFNNETFVSLLKPQVDTVLPIIFPCLFKAKQHWNKNLHQMVFNVLKLFMDMNPKLFDECTTTYRERRAKEKEANFKRQKDWMTIENLAKRNLSSLSNVSKCQQRKTSSLRRKSSSQSIRENAKSQNLKTKNSSLSLHQIPEKSSMKRK